MLDANVEAFSDPAKPSGCMIVLSSLVGAPAHVEVREFLASNRSESVEALRRRLERGVAEGELPAGTDTGALAAFYTAVLHGLSIQARDGASYESLRSIADCAMVAWDTLVAVQV